MNEALEVDVLIIGGGVMGLWLLNDLRTQGFRAMLLERHELGGCQTCHSHVYIHQGFVYQEASLAARLKGITNKWYRWFELHPSAVNCEASYFGFRDEIEFVQKCSLWRDPSLLLDFAMVPPHAWPKALRASSAKCSAVKILISSPERCLDGSALVRDLARPVWDCICAVSDIRRIHFNSRSDRVDEVVASGPGPDELMRFRPRAVVLAAGTGNSRLIQQACKGISNATSIPRQVRKAHMLVIRGKRNDLPLLTGVFPSIGGLFIASRQLENESLWLVSDNRSEPLKAVEDWIIYDARWWLPPVIANLRELAPAVFENPPSLKWGIYEAPKAEGSARGILPEEETILMLGPKNLWVVWPTKLTLAPQASENLISKVRRLLGEPSPNQTSVVSSPPAWRKPTIAPERWLTTPLINWDDFRRAYHL